MGRVTAVLGLLLLVGCADEPQPASAAPHVANAEATIAALRAGLRTCYNKGLMMDPTMEGRLVISIRIAPDGATSSASKVGGTGLSPEVEECMLAKVRRAVFEAPGGEGSTVQLPLTFIRQK